MDAVDALLSDDDALAFDDLLSLVGQEDAVASSALVNPPDGPELRRLATEAASLSSNVTGDGIVLSVPSRDDTVVSTVQEVPMELSECRQVGHEAAGSIVESGRGDVVVAQHERAGETPVALSGAHTTNALLHALQEETQDTTDGGADGDKEGGASGVEVDYLLLQLLGPMDPSGAHEHHTISNSALEAAASEASDAPSERQHQRNEEPNAKPRRRRKRQSDELLYLKKRVFDLEGKLAELQKRGSCRAISTGGAAVGVNSGACCMLPQSSVGTDAAARAWSVGNEAAPPSSSEESWQRIASYEEGQKRIAMLENLRLRARYENQLQVARSLEALYHNQTSFAIMELSLDVNGFLYKRPRNEPFSDDDAMVFAFLGRDLDARYAQTNTIFDSTGLSYIDHEMVRDILLKRDERGQLCLEHLQTRLLPFDSRVIDRVFWECASREEFRKHHGVYQVRLATEDTIMTKMMDPLQLPHAETMVLTTCTAMKRFTEAGRVVAVWQALVTTSGSMSMRLRESGWNILRPTSARIPHHTGPVSIIQTCVRIVPELQRAYSEQDLAVGTLTNLIVGSYHRHKEMMHQVSEDLLVAQFDAFRISN
ncbi:hypothetical protein FI667_g9362, partial [Globisporangium splendens]